MSHPTDIGANVRRRRQALGLTLDQVADRSGVSPTMLSEVERSVKNPTVKLAYEIARALQCSLTDLLSDEEAPGPEVVRREDRRTLEDPESGVLRHALSPAMLRRGLELVWYELPGGASAGEMAPNRRGIVEHLTVIAGELELVLGGEARALRAGDSVTYGPQVTTEYRNRRRGRCEFLLLSDSTKAF